uniref:Uncharacterized protein n=1 Tax=Anguilla anguilla TaxID=7936 RepID=A0A0E9RPL8_ANGAN
MRNLNAKANQRVVNVIYQTRLREPRLD